MRLTLAQRTAALLDLVDSYRAARSAQILEPAREQARALLRTARAEGRRRVRTAIAEARQRLAAEVGAAQARLATERRLTEQQRAVQVLQQAWSALDESLRRRWHDAPPRRLWCEAHLTRALEALPHERWRIECAADWPADERDAFTQRLREAGISDVAWQPRDDIAGGLRIRAGNNLVDATIEGLLADRAALEGRLLDALLLNGGGAIDRDDAPASLAFAGATRAAE
jgi:vacuolar-type H+-ATPase subunit E/Vma4